VNQEELLVQKIDCHRQKNELLKDKLSFEVDADYSTPYRSHSHTSHKLAVSNPADLLHFRVVTALMQLVG